MIRMICVGIAFGCLVLALATAAPTRQPQSVAFVQQEPAIHASQLPPHVNVDVYTRENPQPIKKLGRALVRPFAWLFR